MDILPILAALKRNKVGALLIGFQIALTLAILCNALFIIHQRSERMARPVGIDEANIFTFSNLWIGEPPDLPARIATDLATLRSLPGVVDAYATNSYPLAGGGWSTGIQLQLDQKKSTAHTTTYFADEHGLNTLGLRLVAGRWFQPDEVRELHAGDQTEPTALVVTKALADKAFPKGDALGKTVYIDDQPAPIVGIVERAQTPWVSSGWGEDFVENSTFEPYRYVPSSQRIVVRTQPGQRDAVMKRVEDTLYGLSRERVVGKLRSFEEIRAKAYRNDRAMALLLGTMSVLLLGVTAFGIVGLTSFWVAQRRRHIGVRRALGARKRDILRYFQTENLLIAGLGGVLGVALAIGANLWMVQHYEMMRLGVGYVLGGLAFVLALGQAAVLWPALRAASIPPAIAVRAV